MWNVELEHPWLSAHLCVAKERRQRSRKETQSSFVFLLLSGSSRLVVWGSQGVLTLCSGRSHCLCLLEHWPDQGPASWSLWLLVIIKVHLNNNMSDHNPKAGFILIWASPKDFFFPLHRTGICLRRCLMENFTLPSTSPLTPLPSASL